MKMYCRFKVIGKFGETYYHETMTRDNFTRELELLKKNHGADSNCVFMLDGRIKIDIRNINKHYNIQGYLVPISRVSYDLNIAEIAACPLDYSVPDSLFKTNLIKAL